MARREITRFQETIYLDGFHVTAFGRHRYEHSVVEVPPGVHVAFSQFGQSGPSVLVRVEMDPIAALKLAAALTELAGKAVAAPPTDDNAPKPAAAPVEIDPPEVR